MNRNPIIQMTEDIERLTAGLCTVGAGPSGFGVSNQNDSTIGIFIREEPKFFPVASDSPECSEGKLSVQAFDKISGETLSRTYVETLLEYSCGESTKTICNAYMELEANPIQATRAEYEEAYGILADKALESAVKGPCMQGIGGM